ncbi:MAG: type II toxin-antitoxin system RelE/ParE family toxin [Nitrospinae bacterium]|nr:type II toxin-antitoxin system RelE/ParE family toxin [Nitrospinota bacterium]
MEVRKRVLREYVNAAGRNHFRDWLDGLGTAQPRYIVDARLTRIANGNFGDCEPVGDGVMEFRIHYGPGYRIYFGQEGGNIVILLAGGEKKSQRKDITLVKSLWREYRKK